MESSMYVYSVTSSLGLHPSISEKLVDKKHAFTIFKNIQQN